MARRDTTDFVMAPVTAGRESGHARVLDLGWRVLVAVPVATGIEMLEQRFPRGSDPTRLAPAKHTFSRFAAVSWRPHEGLPIFFVVRSLLLLRRL
jgi:hypothetical protein